MLIYAKLFNDGYIVCDDALNKTMNERIAGFAFQFFFVVHRIVRIKKRGNGNRALIQNSFRAT